MQQLVPMVQQINTRRRELAHKGVLHDRTIAQDPKAMETLASQLGISTSAVVQAEMSLKVQAESVADVPSSPSKMVKSEEKENNKFTTTKFRRRRSFMQSQTPQKLPPLEATVEAGDRHRAWGSGDSFAEIAAAVRNQQAAAEATLARNHHQRTRRDTSSGESNEPQFPINRTLNLNLSGLSVNAPKKMNLNLAGISKSNSRPMRRTMGSTGMNSSLSSPHLRPRTLTDTGEISTGSSNLLTCDSLRRFARASTDHIRSPRASTDAHQFIQEARQRRLQAQESSSPLNTPTHASALRAMGQFRAMNQHLYTT